MSSTYNFIVSLHANENGSGVTDYAGNTWTMNNVTNVSPINGSHTKRALSFPGTGYLYKTAGNNLYIASSQDFTIAFWVYFSSIPWHSYNAVLLSNGWTMDGYNSLAINRSTDKIYLVGNTSIIISGGSITSYTGKAFHIAITRKSGTVKLFFNGTIINTTSSSDFCNFTNNTLGKYGPDYDDYDSRTGQGYGGLLDDFSIILDTALWTSNFTVPKTYLYDECYNKLYYDSYKDNNNYLYGYK